MTLPEERWHSIERARTFMRSLLDPKLTPGVPRAIRVEARARLKHYPTPCEMPMLCAIAETAIARRNAILVIEINALRERIATLTAQRKSKAGNAKARRQA